MRALIAGCLALAALSLLLPSVPTYDPWAWLIWGREVADLDLDTRSGASWKPLPVLFTLPLSALGDGAPALWLIVARASGLLAMALSYRLAARLGGRIAGVVAVLALLVSDDWLRYLAHGNSEPMLVALLLWAIERHLDGHRAHAFALGFLASLLRPEVWPFLGAYAVFLWRRGEERRRLIVGLILLLPVLWFGPEWWGSGDPFAGSDRALASPEARETQEADFPPLEVLLRGLGRVIAPIELAALAALALAIRRRRGGGGGPRERAIVWLAGGAVAWILVVVAMTAAGYPGIARFLHPPAALFCVLGGVGAVAVARARPGARFRTVAVLVLLAAVTPFAIPAVGSFIDDGELAGERTDLQDELRIALRRAGGVERVLRCRIPRDLPAPPEPHCGPPAINSSLQSSLAWQLEVHMSGVVPGPFQPAQPSTVFHAAESEPAGTPPAVPLTGDCSRPLARAGEWDVLLSLPCVAVAKTRPGPTRR